MQAINRNLRALRDFGVILAVIAIGLVRRR